jgi:hypothetical protein
VGKVRTDTIPATELLRKGLVRLNAALSRSGDYDLIGMVGAVIYAGQYFQQDTEKGTHVYLYCPNERTAKFLSEQAVYLFLKMLAVFPLTRLLISTVDDPIITVPADDWISLGKHEVEPDLFVGVGTVKGHPSWHVVVKLDEDGYLIR